MLDRTWKRMGDGKKEKWGVGAREGKYEEEKHGKVSTYTDCMLLNLVCFPMRGNV